MIPKPEARRLNRRALLRRTYRGEIQIFAGGEGESDVAGGEGESDVAGGETQCDVAGGKTRCDVAGGEGETSSATSDT